MPLSKRLKRIGEAGEARSHGSKLLFVVWVQGLGL